MEKVLRESGCGARWRRRAVGWRAGVLLAFAASVAHAAGRDVLVLTSTNAAANEVIVFKLAASATPSLTVAGMLPTGGTGGASGNAGAVQFQGNLGAVVNFGSNNVTQLLREGDSVRVGRAIGLAPNCTKPVSAALAGERLFVAGANCAESHRWPSGDLAGVVVPLADTSVGQIVAGRSWAAVTMKSGTVQRLPLTPTGALNGTRTSVALPANANDTPLGAAFWGDILGFNPAHSPDSFALVDQSGNVYAVPGPQPAYPVNAPCWLAKGPGSVWYSGNSPGHAISIFFSDGKGGTYYKSVALPGVPTDIAVSGDKVWLAVIYTATDGSGGRVAVFSIDRYGDLTPVATSDPVGVTSFNGVAISQ